MREWDGFLAADDYGVTESSASLGHSETEAVAVSVEAEVNEVYVAEAVEVVAVSEVSFESYLSVAETCSAAGSYESEASLGHTAHGGDHASDDSGLSHAHDYGHDYGHDGDAAFDGPDLF
ncbi:hypothetical protein ACGF12_06990 [Kitasatospora sp. NPDC048296]|uniref:hypothetical protein n=1 Tax=Kitasatospora sp. NPDC048296 TaxID=3364048 RepID=UPI0037126DC0